MNQIWSRLRVAQQRDRDQFVEDSTRQSWSLWAISLVVTAAVGIALFALLAALGLPIWGLLPAFVGPLLGLTLARAHIRHKHR